MVGKPGRSGRRPREGLTKDEMEFLAHLVVIGTPAAAARAAGLGGDNPAMWASRCLARPDAQKALQEMRAEIRSKVSITMMQQIERIERRIEAAVEANQHTAAMKGEEMIAKLAGNLVDKKQVSHTLTDERSIEEKKAEILELTRELGLVPELPAPNGHIVDVEVVEIESD